MRRESCVLRGASRPSGTLVAEAVAAALAAAVATSVALAEEAVLEEVTVTATSAPSPIMTVPLSITALSGDFIRDSRLSDVTDVSSSPTPTRIPAARGASVRALSTAVREIESGEASCALTIACDRTSKVRTFTIRIRSKRAGLASRRISSSRTWPAIRSARMQWCRPPKTWRPNMESTGRNSTTWSCCARNNTNGLAQTIMPSTSGTSCCRSCAGRALSCGSRDGDWQ